MLKFYEMCIGSSNSGAKVCEDSVYSLGMGMSIVGEDEGRRN